MRLEIFYSGKEINLKAVEEEYPLEIVNGGELRPFPEAYNPKRKQYDASTLLHFLIKNKKEELALWALSKDLYTKGMNFIFGLAMKGEGAVLSIYRLNSKNLIEKEAVHEIGHILGLEHCNNDCVMKFSNSLYEAELKPSHLCEDCKEKLRGKI